LTDVATVNPVSSGWTFFEDAWHDGNPAIMGPRTHAAWLGSTVFDGARRMEGGFPDLEAHCARINRSAVAFGLKPVVETARWIELAREGAARFAPAPALYIRPMYWADGGAAGGGVMFEPETTRWCMCLYEAPLPEPTGVAITRSPFRRPTADVAPVEAKAGCLYPNGARALREAAARGFGNCLMEDMLGNVAELANANVFMVKGGVVMTPVPNGTFLDGITHRRVIALLRADGLEVVERTLRYADFATADEIFSCGNFQKVAPVTRIDARELPIGPVTLRARELYWAFARAAV
jgi:branched-chain amino acid aminotransferase